MLKTVKIVVERHPDGYVAYPLGTTGVIVAEGASYEEALRNVRSAIEFHRQSFGPEGFEAEMPALEAFVAETAIAV